MYLYFQYLWYFLLWVTLNKPIDKLTRVDYVTKNGQSKAADAICV